MNGSPALLMSGNAAFKRRGEVLGVLLSPKAWFDIKEQTERYERALQMIEDGHDRRVISEREGSATLTGEALRRALESELKNVEIS